MNFSWDTVDKIGIVVGLLLALPVFWSWVILLGQKKRQKRILQSLSQSSGEMPVAVVVDIGPEEIKNQVVAFLKKSAMDMELLAVSAKRLDKENLQDFVADLHRVKAQAMEKGADRFHLFYRGPVPGALIAGGVFSNTVTTIYHLDKGVGYESWGPLHRSFLQGM
jgi:hypothetical protein